MLPVIAIVGRPNVGKSTLFNRLSRSREALVADQPGLTRDRQYAIGRVGAKPYLLVDTGGLGGGGDGIESLMERQAEIAISEADHILFLLDAKTGYTAVDEQITALLRKTDKPITPVVNKSENLAKDLAEAEFYRLGLGEPMAIAAAHGKGIKALIDKILKILPETAEDPSSAQKRGIQIAVVGRPNVGKSTLINRLLGEERVVVFDQPGTTRDTIYVPFSHNEQSYTFIDTAGIRRRARISETVEKFSVIKTLQAIEQANVVLLLVDAQQGVSEQDANLGSYILESGRALVLVINKWDELQQDQRQRLKSNLDRKLHFLDFASRYFISALHGSGVGNLYHAVDKAYANAMRNLSTSELTRILEQLVEEHQPPQVRGRRIKLRYAHQGGQNPPVIVIHGNQTESLPIPYKRYLMNRFRQVFKLDGTPLRLELQSGDNPFKGRINRLTKRQMRKRQRIRKFSKRSKQK